MRTLCYAILSVLCFGSLKLDAQKIRECGTPIPEVPIFVPLIENRSPAMDPIALKLMVHVFADDNGTNRAAEDTSIMRQLEYMQSFYAPQNICFSLVGIRHINNSDLNSQDVDNEESDLFPFLSPNAIDMFVHEELFDSGGTYNGQAYDIPNSYFSVVGSTIQDSANVSTTAHEMGHCLGLYHTFETAFGAENVDRVGPCADCAGDGDLLCDTQADPNSDTYNLELVIDANCNYTGNALDDCDKEYVVDPHNVMTYGRRACRNTFTGGQGNRMAAMIALESELNACITPSSVSFSAGTNTTISSGWAIYTAHNPILVQGNTFTINGSAQGHFSAEYLRVTNSVHFNPGAGGHVYLLPGNVLCN